MYKHRNKQLYNPEKSLESKDLTNSKAKIVINPSKDKNFRVIPQNKGRISMGKKPVNSPAKHVHISINHETPAISIINDQPKRRRRNERKKNRESMAMFKTMDMIRHDDNMDNSSQDYSEQNFQSRSSVPDKM